MDEKIRVTIECCKCKKEFELTLSKDKLYGERVIKCPFCKSECKVVFEDSSTIDIFRGVDIG